MSLVSHFFLNSENFYRKKFISIADKVYGLCDQKFYEHSSLGLRAFKKTDKSFKGYNLSIDIVYASMAEIKNIPRFVVEMDFRSDATVTITLSAKVQSYKWLGHNDEAVLGLFKTNVSDVESANLGKALTTIENYIDAAANNNFDWNLPSPNTFILKRSPV